MTNVIYREVHVDQDHYQIHANETDDNWVLVGEIFLFDSKKKLWRAEHKQMSFISDTMELCRTWLLSQYMNCLSRKDKTT